VVARQNALSNADADLDLRQSALSNADADARVAPDADADAKSFINNFIFNYL